MDTDWLDAAESITGYVFTNKDYLEQALSHASAVDARHESNERLEFLGDAVLGFVVCQAVFERYPEFEEGDMTKIKSSVVSRKTCSEIAAKLDLGRIIKVGKGMAVANHIPDSVTGAAYEAIIGAIYLDGGIEHARTFILQEVNPYIETAANSTHQENYKSVLQMYGQRNNGGAPLYVVLDEKGPDHAKSFEICVELAGNRYPAEWGTSKKQAEQLAALSALVELNIAKKLEGGGVEIDGDYGA